MSSENAYSPEEWSLLKELPFKVILAAVVADVRGPVGAASKEMVDAARRLVREATTTYPDNALIIGILREVAEDATDEESIPLDDDRARQAAIVEALTLANEAMGVLAADSQQAIEYRQWIFDAARAATRSTHSGGFLGIGAERVSDGEEELLTQLRVVLELPEGDDE